MLNMGCPQSEEIFKNRVLKLKELYSQLSGIQQLGIGPATESVEFTEKEMEKLQKKVLVFVSDIKKDLLG